MKIDFIRLQNYRQYKDEKIEFATSEDQNVTIIQGANGAGKTNLLNAITWCLYGDEKHLDEKYKGLPIINTITRSDLVLGKSCKVGVEIQIRDEESKKIIIGRSLIFEKSAEDKIIKAPDRSNNSPDGSTFMMLKEIEKNLEPIPEPAYVLGKMIPESIEEYFFFDGERLNDYFKDTSGEKIREAVFKVSQLFLLENAIEHLKSKKTDFIREAGELSPKVEEIKTELNRHEELLKENEQQLNDLKKEKETIEKKVNEYGERLKASSIPNISELENERDEGKEALTKIEQDLEELEKEKRDYLIEVSSLVFVYDPIVKMQQLISGKEESGDIPPDYKKNFLEKLLGKGKCICGTDISRDNNCRKRVETLLRECDDISDISDELIRENAMLTSMLNRLNNFKCEQERFGRDINELEKERKRKSERLQKIHEIIGKSDVEQIKMWEGKLNEYEALKGDVKDKIAVLKYKIDEEKREIDKLNRTLDEELKKEKEYNELRSILDFCRVNLEALETIRNEIMEDVRKEIEEKTKSQFFNLIWKKETYKDVKIDEDYNISVVHQSGAEGIGTLGAGERQVLALSFMAALNNVSGFNVPIVIDTPLGRISSGPRGNIADALPSYLEGRQVILLVTDTEYTSTVRDKLSKKVGKEYVINFKETREGGEAKVEPYEK